MAADINLLPEDFRRKEEREKERARKKRTEEEIRLTEPEGGNDTTKRFWHRVLGNGSDTAPTASVGTPLEKVVAKTFSKRERKTPDFLVDETAQKKDTHQRSVDESAVDILDEMKEFEETEGEKDAKQLRKKSALREDGQKSGEKETAPNILIEKSEDNSEPKTPIRAYRSLINSVSTFFSSVLRGGVRERVAVNLMPERAIGLGEINWKKISFSFLTMVLLSVLIIAAGYTGILARIRAEERNFNQLQLTIEELETEIMTFSDEQARAFAIEQQLSQAKQLVNNHVFWTKFLNFIEQSTLQSVRYTNFSGDVDSVIVLTAQADSIEAVILQRDLYKNSPEVIDAVLTTYTEQVDGKVDFELSITFESSLWRRS